MNRSTCFIFLLFCILIPVSSFAETDPPKDKTILDLNNVIKNFDMALRPTKAQVPSAPQKDELVLFANRLAKPSTRLEDVSANVTVKNRADLEETDPRTFQEAVEDAEGVFFYDQVGNGLDAVFGLRGFSESNSAVFLVDGVRVNEVDGGAITFPLIPMNDIESIEIDRGSSSPVYGSGAFSGVVNITTAKPSSKLVHIFGGLEFSSFRGARTHEGLSGTIPDKLTPLGGAFTYYFDGGRRGFSEGFRDNNESHFTDFNIKAGYELPDKQGGIRVGVKHNQGYASSPGEMTLDQFHADPKQSNKPLDFRRLKSDIVQLDGDKKFWRDRITASMMSSWRLTNYQFQNTSGTFTDWVHGYDPDTNRIFQKSRENTLLWQLEYKDSWNSWLSNKSAIGMEYRGARDNAVQLNAFEGVLRPEDGPDTDRIAHYNNTALFWNDTVSLFDRLHLRTGMRHDFHWLRSEDNVDASNNISRRWDKSTVSVGATYKVLKFLDFFSNYSQGFRVPSISDIAPFSGAVSSDLEPVESNSYEIGTRLVPSKRYSAKASWFLIDMKNEIIYDQTAITPLTPWGANTNLGRSRRQGVEVRLDAKPIDELYLYNAHTVTDARVRETDADGVPYDGRSLGQIPMYRSTFGTSLVPFKKLGEPFDGFKVSMSGIFTGKQHPTSYENSGEADLDATGYWIKAFSVWNLKLSYALRGVRFYFAMNNVFGGKYYSRAIAATSWGTSIYPMGTNLFVNPGAPREYVWGMEWGF